MSSIQQIPTSRPDLYAFAVTGKITEADMEKMAATVSAGFDREGEIDMLITMPGYDGAEFGAVFDKEGLGAMLRSNTHVRRYAVVGAPPLAKAMITLFNPLTPVETKAFDGDDEAEAWAWVGGSRAAVAGRRSLDQRPAAARNGREHGSPLPSQDVNRQPTPSSRRSHSGRGS